MPEICSISLTRPWIYLKWKTDRFPLHLVQSDIVSYLGYIVDSFKRQCDLQKRIESAIIYARKNQDPEWIFM
jgi:hypothetical protein